MTDLPGGLEGRYPSPAARLAAPAETGPAEAPGLAAPDPAGSRRTGRTTGRAPTTETAMAEDPRRAKPLKKLEWFFSGLARLGTTYRRSKLDSRRLDDLSPRLDGAENDLRHGLGRLDDLAADAHAREAGLAARLDDAQARLDAAADRLAETEARLAAAETALAAERAAGRDERAITARAYADLARRLDVLRFGGKPSGTAPAEGPAEGLEALLDACYNRIEARLRGSREEIARRLVPYLDDVAAARERSGGGAVLDIGCGRGEWLELLVSKGIEARGIDLNPVQAAEARAEGLPVEEGDAIALMESLPANTLAVVSAHHLVEHLPFRDTARLTREALRVLRPGGLLMLETPNPATLIVGARNFHFDPTHIKPLPAEVLTALLDTLGFHPVEARFLHPSETGDILAREGRLDPVVAELLFGPMDLAVLGIKPALDAGEAPAVPEA
ncbi:MAG: class I SAM-dependent methyltransferase [Pseudomonadota bacterium]